MLLLIGSRALAYYNRLKGRLPSDWDFISENFSANEYSVVNVEIYDARDGTNFDILQYSLFRSPGMIKTPYGWAIVPPLSVLKVLKLCCVDHLDKAKHKWDLQQLEDVELDDELKSLLIRREAEVKERVAKQKNKFFNKYNIPRWFIHDDLHTYINSSPSYLSVLEDSVNISIEKFLSCSPNQQISIIREECFVLALERELIPRCKNNPIMIKKYVDQFSQCNSSNDWSYKWLSRLSIPGKLKDHPNWLALWSEKNYNSINKDFNKWWSDTLQKLPKEFWLKLVEHDDERI